MRPLFVSGCQRTGTTALAEYLNDHPEVLVSRERYKYTPYEVTLDHLSLERILAYDEAETNVPEQEYRELVAGKDPARLKWVGDKNPDYYRLFGRLLRQNPGARFIVTYRPLEEVAESFEARARDPEDRWPARCNSEIAVTLWNLSLIRTREFLENDPAANVLVIGYHDFFYQNEDSVPLISRFLEVEFDEHVLKSWKERSTGFERSRRRKNMLTEEQVSYVREHKDEAAEEWILNRIEEQKKDPELALGKGGAGHAPIQKDRRVQRLQEELARERRKVKDLRKRNRHLTNKARESEQRVKTVRASRSWRLLRALSRIKTRLLGK